MSFNPMDLTGRAILVTGASSGLGRETAILASRLGARVLLLGRDQERLRQTFESLEGQGHASVSFDLNETGKIPELLVEQAAQFAPFSGVVHSAGVVQCKPLRVCRPADFEGLYRINVVAASQLLSGLTKRGVADPNGCSVVLISSIISLVGNPGLSAYAASKAALCGLTHVAAIELARDHIRVNAVLPGHFASEMLERSKAHMLPENVQAIAKDYPLGMGKTSDVAAAVAFLLADTGRWITGTCMTVDGGYTAH
jgi:NAD(P)-dependent dehydrogenase (short-subunit alcohol dehydrogenase family)